MAPTQAKSKARAGAGGTPAGAGRLVWILVLVGVALVATIVVANYRRQAAQRSAAAPRETTAVPPAVMANFTNIPAAVWERAGTNGAAPATFVGDSDQVGGKPVVLYIGAGYCPYCAAARWSIIAALSRFGTFSNLTYSASSPADVFPSSPTFSFYGSRYESPYLVFQSVELQGDVMLANGEYQPLETPTPRQEALLRKYDAPPYVPAAGAGGIPFTLVGGRFMWSGSPFSPSILADKAQAAIAATLRTGSGDAAQAILAGANQLTAAICATDGNRPAEVCTQPAIVAAVRSLPSKSP